VSPEGKIRKIHGKRLENSRLSKYISGIENKISNDSWNFFYDAIEESLEVPKYLSFQEYVTSKPVLNKEDRLCRFDLAYSPYMTQVAKWIDDPKVEWIYLIQGSQTSKTTIQMLALSYFMQLEPCRIMFVNATKPAAEQFTKKRLKPFLKNSVGVKQEKIIERQSVECFQAGKAQIFVTWATSEIGMSSTPAKYVIGDECGVWKYSTSLIKKRTRTYSGDRKGIFATTPPRVESHHSWTEAKGGDFYRFFVPCPFCGFFQVMELKNLRWEGTTRDDIRKTIHLVCVSCKKEIEEKHKQEMMLHGEACLVDPDNDFEKISIPKGNGTVAMQISGLYSCFSSFSDIASMFLDSKKEGKESLKVFIMHELAEVPYNIDETESISEKTLLDLRQEYRLKDEATIIKMDLIVMGVDVQRTGELYITVLGFMRGCPPVCYLLDYACLPYINMVEIRDRWKHLIEYASRPLWRKRAKVNIDASDGLMTQEVFSFCENDRVLSPIKDVGNTTGQKQVIKKYVKTDRKYYHINSVMVKDEVLSAVLNKCVFFPKDTDPIYFYT